ncbi:hypothetical protein [uncultured Actinomyces sp.]|uniref:hypothetical protein n=1 Tax=uncultured Actinomyces sp. TaxID=249061 RepID=UPI0026039082|nr:hypothetical protein [uncultured Actinomyces sp.]
MSMEYKTGTVRTVTTTMVDVDGLDDEISLPVTPEPMGGEVHLLEQEGILRYWWVQVPGFEAWRLGAVCELECVAADLETGEFEYEDRGLHFGWQAPGGLEGYAADLCEQLARKLEQKNKAGEVA